MNLHEWLKRLEARIQALEGKLGKLEDGTVWDEMGGLLDRVCKLECFVGMSSEGEDTGEEDFDEGLVEDDSPPTEYYVIRCKRKGSQPMYYTGELRVMWTHQMADACRYETSAYACLVVKDVKAPAGYTKPEVIGIAQ